MSCARELTQSTRMHLYITKEALHTFFFSWKPCFSCCMSWSMLWGGRYLKLFEYKGLHRICGKNVTIAEKKIVAVHLWLNEVGALPYETVINVLTGLTNCSVHDLWSCLNFYCSKPRWKPLTLTLMKEIHQSMLQLFWVRLLMLTIAFALQASGMLATNEVDISM